MKFGAHVVESLLHQLTFLFFIDWDMFVICFCKQSFLEVVFYKQYYSLQTNPRKPTDTLLAAAF